MARMGSPPDWGSGEWPSESVVGLMHDPPFKAGNPAQSL